MDYVKLLKWIRFFQREGLSATVAIDMIAFYVGNDDECPAEKDDAE